MMKLGFVWVIFIFFLCFLVVPLGTLFLKAFQGSDSSFVLFENFREYFSSPHLISSLYNTIYISLISTGISIVFAFVFSYCLARRDIPFKGFFKFVGMLPIFAPTMLLGISLIYLFGNQGVLTKLGITIPLYGSLGIIISESVFCFPVAMMILVVAFSSSDNRLYEAARVMGASPFKIFVTVTLPGVRYALMSAIFVCFTYSFTDFGAPSVVGGNFNVLATDVYKQVIGQQNFNMGAVVGLLMMIPTVISFFVDRYVSKKQGSFVSSRAQSYVIQREKFWDKVAFGFCSVIALLMIAFFGMSLGASLVESWPYNLELTLKNYDFSKVAASTASSAIKNSVLVSLITAFLGTIICFCAAYFTERVKSGGCIQKICYFLAMAPMAIPGTVMGLAYVLFFNVRNFSIPFTNLVLVNSFNVFYGTIWIIILVNIVHYFSVPFVTANTALKKLDKEFESVSDSLRVPFYKTLIRVIIPMCRDAILDMFIYFFVNSMITVSAVVFLYTPMFALASVTILNVKDAGDVAVAAALSMVIFGINVTVRSLYELSKKYKFKFKRKGVQSE